MVIGNHDFYVAHDRVDDDISDMAMAGIRYSRGCLSAGQKHWLASLPAVHREEAFTLVHASLDDPLTWEYIFGTGDARATLSLQQTPVCFFGHTHLPSLFVARRGTGGNHHLAAEGTFKIGRTGRCLVNPGSVGQPRGNGDPRAQYAIFDPDAFAVEFIRVDYDLVGAARRIIEAGLPPYLADRLMDGV